MSAITLDGRQHIRDKGRERIERELRRHPWFSETPRLIVSGLAELLIVSRELRALMLRDGLMRADGSDIHPAVRAFKEYKSVELRYLAQMSEMARAETEQPADLVGMMAAHVDEAETVEAETPAAPDKPEPPESD